MISQAKFICENKCIGISIKCLAAQKNNNNQELFKKDEKKNKNHLSFSQIIY